MFNKAVVVGHLGRETQSGQTVANFSVATNRKWNDRDGNRQEETEWHNVVAWGRQAEVAEQFLRKGRLVVIEGRLQTRSWEDRDSGQKRYKTEIVCDNFQMLGGRDDDDGGGRERRSSDRQDDRREQSRERSSGTRQQAKPKDYDDDIPF